MTADQAPGAGALPGPARLDLDYFATLTKLRASESRFEYIARRVPATIATHVVDAAENARLQGPGHPPRPDPPLPRPATSPRTWSASWAPTSRWAASSAPSTPSSPARTARPATRSAAATGSRWARARSRRPSTARPAHHHRPGPAVVHPAGAAPDRRGRPGRVRLRRGHGQPHRRGPRAGRRPDVRRQQAAGGGRRRTSGPGRMSDLYEPGSVEKVLTVSSLIDRARSPRTPGSRCPASMTRRRPHRSTTGSPTADPPHPGRRDRASPPTSAPCWRPTSSRRGELDDYLQQFRPRPAHRHRDPRRVPGHPAGPGQLDQPGPGPHRLRPVALGQRGADGGRGQHHRQRRRAGLPEPHRGLRRPPTTASRGRHRHHDHAAGSSARRRPAQTARMMERVVDPEVGVAPGAAVPGYRVAGKTGTAQRVGTDCGCYDGTLHGLVRRLRAGRRPALHHLRRRPEPPQRRWRRLGRRPGVLQDHELRAAPLRRAPDRHPARRRCPSSGDRRRAVARAPGPDTGGSLAAWSDDLGRRRARQPRPTPLADLAAWLRGRVRGPAHPRRPRRRGRDRGLAELAAGPPRRPVRRPAGRPRPRRRLRRRRPCAAGAVAVLTDPAGADRAAAERACPLLVVDAPARRARPARRPRLRRPGHRRCG